MTSRERWLVQRRLRAPGKESVLVYDHIDGGGEFHIDREPSEHDESYRRRSVLYGSLFGRRG